MGNSQTKTVGKNKQKIQLDLTHPRFKNAQIKQGTGQQSIEGVFSVNDKKDYDAWTEKIKNNPGSGEEGVLNPLSHNFEKGGMCGSSGTIHADYQFYPFTLDDQIKNRQKANYNRFEEHELWYLLYTLADVGYKFHSANKKIGDIRPQNVCINEDGQIKVISQNTFPQELDNYQKAFYDKDKTYLAPEEVKDLQIGKTQTNAPYNKSQAFSAGLTALDAALLQSSENVYDKNGNMDYELLQGKKENLKNGNSYSDNLKHVILNLTETTPQNRMNLGEVCHWLDPYSQEIINLEHFQPKNLPEKLQRTALENPIAKKTKFYPQGFYNEQQPVKLESGFPPTIKQQPVRLESGFPPTIKQQSIKMENGIPLARQQSINRLESGFPPTIKQQPINRLESGVPPPTIKQQPLPYNLVVESVPNQQAVQNPQFIQSPQHQRISNAPIVPRQVTYQQPPPPPPPRQVVQRPVYQQMPKQQHVIRRQTETINRQPQRSFPQISKQLVDHKNNFITKEAHWNDGGVETYKRQTRGPGLTSTETRTIQNRPQGQTHTEQTKTITKTQTVEIIQTNDKPYHTEVRVPEYTSIRTEIKTSPEQSMNVRTQTRTESVPFTKEKDYIKQLEDKIKQSKMMYPSD